MSDDAIGEGECDPFASVFAVVIEEERVVHGPLFIQEVIESGCECGLLVYRQARRYDQCGIAPLGVIRCPVVKQLLIGPQHPETNIGGIVIDALQQKPGCVLVDDVQEPGYRITDCP